jgi:hypothetical protein
VHVERYGHNDLIGGRIAPARHQPGASPPRVLRRHIRRWSPRWRDELLSRSERGCVGRSLSPRPRSRRTSDVGGERRDEGGKADSGSQDQRHAPALAQATSPVS